MPLDSTPSSPVAVVHLVWIPYGIELFQNFVNSYVQHPAGHKHTLYLLFNGVEQESAVQPYLDYVDSQSIDYLFFIKKSGQDLEVYHWICQQIPESVVLFLNSYVTFNSANWLAMYMCHFSPSVGAIAATASYQSYYSTVFQTMPFFWEKGKSIQHHFRKYKLFLKTFFYWRFLFHPFPCPHLRTNAFMIRRADYLNLNINMPIASKFAAYRIESGRNSLTNQLLKKYNTVGIVDKNGNFYTLKQAFKANVYRTNKQENLLINDNQTADYIHSDSKRQALLSQITWGKNINL